MPPLVRRYVKTAFVFMLLGIFAGAIVSVSQGVLGPPVPSLLIVAHTHALLVGWLPGCSRVPPGRTRAIGPSRRGGRAPPGAPLPHGISLALSRSAD